MDVDAVVFDVLGTLVDETSGLRAAVAEVAHAAADVEGLVETWQQHVAHEQAQIVAGRRAFAPSSTLDAEAAELVAGRLGDRAVVGRLSSASRRLPAWPDSAAGLGRLAAVHPLIGLSNADRSSLLYLNAYAGLRWHQAISAEAAGTYKPAREVYELAVTTAGVDPSRLLMVAAHAWDLRGAQQVGLRTAYVARPVGDPPAGTDTFDLQVADLAELADRLAR